MAKRIRKQIKLCSTLCDPIDGSPPGSPVPEILQARTLEWVAISFSNAWKWKVKVKSFSPVRLLATPWTAAYQAPPSMGFFQARVLEWSAIAFSDMCVRIRCLSFSFWLTSLCIIDSRFIHLIRSDSKAFYLRLSNIPLCICTTSLPIHWSMDI